MLFLPFLVGVILRAQEARFHPAALPLLALWLLGYFAFHALTLWLKSGRRERYLPPLAVYGASCALLGLGVLWWQPGLLGWAALYAPLLGASLWRAAHGDDTSLLARGAVVLAACLICAVTYSDGLPSLLAALPEEEGAQRAVRATAVLSAYFIGTVLYVKTMIRERGEPAYLAGSAGAWHCSSCCWPCAPLDCRASPTAGASPPSRSGCSSSPSASRCCYC